MSAVTVHWTERGANAKCRHCMAEMIHLRGEREHDSVTSDVLLRFVRQHEHREIGAIPPPHPSWSVA